MSLNSFLSQLPGDPRPPVEEVGLLENGCGFISQDAGLSPSKDWETFCWPRLSGPQLVSYSGKGWIRYFWG